MVLSEHWCGLIWSLQNHAMSAFSLPLFLTLTVHIPFSAPFLVLILFNYLVCLTLKICMSQPHYEAGIFKNSWQNNYIPHLRW